MKSPAPQGGNRAGDRASEQRLDNTAGSPEQTVLQRMRRQRQVERLCQTPRLIGELLDEIARHHNLRDDIDSRLAAYSRVDPALLRALGCDRFPVPPIHGVEHDDG